MKFNLLTLVIQYFAVNACYELAHACAMPRIDTSCCSILLEFVGVHLGMYQYPRPVQARKTHDKNDNLTSCSHINSIHEHFHHFVSSHLSVHFVHTSWLYRTERSDYATLRVQKFMQKLDPNFISIWFYFERI